jgi:hypothetical protein
LWSGAQVRFFEEPSESSAPWPSRDSYPFYSPSDQGGLLLADVDRDLPWRDLFGTGIPT